MEKLCSVSGPRHILGAEEQLMAVVCNFLRLHSYVERQFIPVNTVHKYHIQKNKIGRDELFENKPFQSVSKNNK